jgi:hypothetical protein
MRRIKLVIFVFSLILSFSTIAIAKEWRGIVPLQSTRDDVVRLFGTSSGGGSYGYEFENERVFFQYQYPDNQCGQKWGHWNVPLYTVLEVTVYPKNKILFADLGLDMSKYKKSHTCSPGSYHYFNAEEGINYSVYEGIVSQIAFLPTDKDKDLLCTESNKTN